jgi:hypothetical protein
MRPSGYWNDVENVKKEIDAFDAERGSPGVMPTEDELRAHGLSSLAYAIAKHGGVPRFARNHGYSSHRKPNGHYAAFDPLRIELLRWVAEAGVPGMMPTAQQLKDATPRRNDLVKAITQHGGPAEVAKRLGLRMTHDKKPDGYYDDPRNLAREVYAAVDELGLSGRMPTPRQLASAGKTGLVAAVCGHGGFWQVAQSLGLTPDRKQRGYWTEEMVDAEVMEFVRLTGSEGWMPTAFELRGAGRTDLEVAIYRHGGTTRSVAERLGLASRASKPDGYWEDEEVIARELRDFVREFGTPGQMPTQAVLARAGRNDLSLAISRYGGGWPQVAEALGLELKQLPKDYWSDVKNVRTAILTLNARRGRLGEMPTKTDLDLAGEFGLARSIEKLGGYPEVAAMFGLSAGRIALTPRSREELVLAHELMGFVDVDLEDHKILAGGRRRDVDIILRTLNVVVEYDSFRWHQGHDEQDAHKTRALQDSGWEVIRVREEPLGQLQPGDVVVRKGQLKEACNRLLLRLMEMHSLSERKVRLYLSQKGLQNIIACELHIADILRTRRGDVIEV